MGKKDNTRIKFANRVNGKGNFHFIDFQRISPDEDISTIEIFAKPENAPDSEYVKVGEYVFKNGETLPDQCQEGYHKDDNGNCVPDEPEPEPEEKNKPPKIDVIGDDDDNLILLAEPDKPLKIKTKITDADGSIEKIEWSQILPEPQYYKEFDNKQEIELTFTEEKDYVISVNATDNLGLSASVMINIKVRKKVEPIPEESDFVTKIAVGGDFDCGSITDKNIKLLDKAEAVLGLGDYSYGASLKCFSDSFNTVKNKLKLAVRGNHDDEGEDGDSGINKQIKDYFGLPVSGFVNQYVGDNYLVIGLDSQSDVQSQIPILQQVLEQNKNVLWKIVLIHKPVYSTGYKHADLKSLRAKIQSILDKYGVDLVISGHNHNAWTTYPITNGQIIKTKSPYDFSKAGHGTIFVGNGNSGRKFYRNGSNIPDFIEWANDSDYGVLFIEQNKNTEKKIRIRHVNVSGQTLHSFVLDKTGNISIPTECGENAHYDETTGQCVCDEGYEKDDSGKCVKVVGGGNEENHNPTTNIDGLPVDLTKGKVLFDSTVIWNNGHERTITNHHEFDPYDDKTEVAAGGHGIPRKLYIDGKGNAYLSGGMSRVYNHSEHNGTVVILQKFVFGEGLDNMSYEVFSRHNEDDPPANRVGGLTMSFHSDEVESKFEDYHKVYHTIGSKKLPVTIKKGDEVWIAIVATKTDGKYTIEGFMSPERDDKYISVGKFEYNTNIEGAKKQPLYWRWRTNGDAPKDIKAWDTKFIQL